LSAVPAAFRGANLERRRAVVENLAEAATEPTGVSWTSVDAGGVRGLWAVPDEPTDGRAVQYLHGGGYVSGSPESHRRLGGHLAVATGSRVLLVDYGRAPERPHPGPIDDSAAVYRWLLSEGSCPARLAIAGDSSGGGLAVGTLLKLREDGVPLPAAAFCFSAWTDLELTGASMLGNAESDRLVTTDSLRALAEAFLAGADPSDPFASPLHGDHRGLCPLYLQVGGAEVLLDDSRRLAAKARSAGVDVVVDVVPDMQHVFQMRAGRLVEADDAIARVAAWLRPLLKADLAPEAGAGPKTGHTTQEGQEQT
jgi:monoterpene epsilon-lactone hydrolase